MVDDPPKVVVPAQQSKHHQNKIVKTKVKPKSKSSAKSVPQPRLMKKLKQVIMAPVLKEKKKKKTKKLMATCESPAQNTAEVELSLPLLRRDRRLNGCQAVKYASDCSGIEAGAVALEQLGISFDHLWASDSFAPCRAVIQQNFHILEVLDDVFNEPPHLFQPDLYTAGFPCQPYSKAGRGGGGMDNRSAPVWGVVDRISKSMPKTFLLENVAAFQSAKYKGVYDLLVGALCGISEKDKRAYDLHIKILDSKNHGSPQQRPRVFIVGVLRSCKKHNFKWPADLMSTPSLEQILEDSDAVEDGAHPSSKTALGGITRAYTDILNQGGDPEAEPWVANIFNSHKFGTRVCLDILPCLTRTRGTQYGFWLFNRSRMLNLNELARCQGFPADRIEIPRKGVSRRQVGGMYGNAMNVNTIMRIVARLLPAVGVAGGIEDPFGEGSIDADCL